MVPHRSQRPCEGAWAWQFTCGWHAARFRIEREGRRWPTFDGIAKRFVDVSEFFDATP
jgi:hypothetical protein